MSYSGPTEPGPDVAGPGLSAGSVFAGLEVESEVGRGGMGVIYRVRDPALDRVRALKILAHERSRDAAFRERFRREARQAAAIEHPNVAQVFRAGEENGRLYLVMRFVDGPSLADLLAERGRLPLGEALAIVRQVAAALDAAHEAGLVHRDVKPANILLEGEGASRRAFLCDFGISKVAMAGSELTSTGQFVGTVDYVAPEQIEGRAVDHRADVYSLACVAFHMLVGEPPFRGENQLATMFAHANAPRPDRDALGLPREVGAALVRGLAVRPEGRQESAGALGTELTEAAGGAATLSLGAPAKRRRRPLLVPILAGLGAAAAAAAVVIAVVDGDPPEGPPVTTRSVRVAEPPFGITVGPGRVWVASPKEVMTSIVPGSGTVDVSASIGDSPAAVAVGFESVWVCDRAADELLRLDPRTAAVTDRVKVGDQPVDLTVTDEAIWVVERGAETVSRVNPKTGQVDPIPVGGSPAAVAAGEDRLWVVNQGQFGRGVSVIDPIEMRVEGRPIEVGQLPSDIAAGADAIWVTENFTGQLLRIDPERKTIVAEIPVGPKPRAVAVGSGYVWVANGEDSTVSLIDPESDEVVADPIEVGATPVDIAVGPGGVWTADYGASTVTQLRLNR